MSAVRTPGTWVATEKRDTVGGSVTYALYAGDVHIGSVSLFTSGRMYVPDYYKVQEANAAFIVRACNNHDALLEKLQAQFKAVDWLMAKLIAADPTFMPTESPIWDSIKGTHEVLAAAGAA